MYTCIYAYMYISIYIYKWSQVIHYTQSAQISQKPGGRNIYAIIKTMCPPRLSPQWLCDNSCTWAHDEHPA